MFEEYRALMNLAKLFEKLISQQDENTAMIINAVQPGSYNLCDHCGRLTARPYRTEEDHGSDFCSPECQDAFLERVEEDRLEEATRYANEKMEKYEEWDDFLDRIYDQEVIWQGFTLKEYYVEITPNEEEIGATRGHNGEDIKISYCTDDGDYILSCVCNTCQNEFKVKAHEFMEKPACPKCLSDTIKTKGKTRTK